MKTLRRVCASTTWALILSATCFAQHYTQTNLVSNTAGVAPVTDPQLINPWGLSRGSGSPWWVSDNATGFSTLYNGAGAKQSLIVTIPPTDPTNKNTPTGTPTGTTFNGSQTDFLLAPARGNSSGRKFGNTGRFHNESRQRQIRAGRRRSVDCDQRVPANKGSPQVMSRQGREA
jgi:hypothetical protein